MSKAAQLLHKHLPSPVREADTLVLSAAEYNAVLVDVKMMQDANRRLYHSLVTIRGVHQGEAERITKIDSMIDTVSGKTEELTSYFKNFNVTMDGDDKA